MSTFDPIAHGATPLAPTPPGFNPAQYGATPVQPTPGSSSSLGQSIWAGLSGTAVAGAQNVKSGVEGLETPPDVNAQEVKDAAAGGGLGAGAADAAAQVAKTGVGGVASLGKTVGGVAQILLSPLLALTSAIGTPIGDAIGKLIPASLAQKLNDFLTKHPSIGENATEDMNIANLAVPEAADAAAPTVSAAVDKVGSAANAVKESFETSPEDQAAAEQTKSSALIKGVAQDWEKPTTINSSAYDKARAVLEKEPATPQFIAEQGINPFKNIVDGKYETEGTANDLRSTAGKMSSDVLRPSLQAADATTPKTPIKAILDEATKQTQQLHGVTPDDKEAIIMAVTKKTAALGRAHPDGLSLTDLHDNKITYSKNAGYSQFKSNSDTNAALANKVMGNAAAKLVEDKAPAGLPVKEFNGYLQKYYRAADYLEALDGKKAPVSTAQAIARSVSKFGGAAIARHVAPGIGDLVSTFAGYKIGGALEHLAENLTNPMRDSFLKNLKVTNPEAYNRVANFKGKSAPK